MYNSIRNNINISTNVSNVKLFFVVLVRTGTTTTPLPVPGTGTVLLIP